MSHPRNVVQHTWRPCMEQAQPVMSELSQLVLGNKTQLLVSSTDPEVTTRWRLQVQLQSQTQHHR